METVYKFTASIIVAIRAMVDLTSERGLYKKLSGELFEPTKLPRPIWSKFKFFTKISASKIQRMERVKAGPNAPLPSYWVLERKVSFETKGGVVAEVFLEGMKLDSNKGNQDGASFWAIQKIKYVVIDEPTFAVPEDWKTFEFELSYQAV